MYRESSIYVDSLCVISVLRHQTLDTNPQYMYIFMKFRLKSFLFQVIDIHHFWGTGNLVLLYLLKSSHFFDNWKMIRKCKAKLAYCLLKKFDSLYWKPNLLMCNFFNFERHHSDLSIYVTALIYMYVILNSIYFTSFSICARFWLKPISTIADALYLTFSD